MTESTAASLPVLGRLELAVLDRLWQGPQGLEWDVGEMEVAVGRPRGLTRNTIQSTLERLVRKGLAQRRKRGRAYLYHAALTRSEWLGRSLEDLLETVPGAEPRLLVASFVALAERAGDETLDELEALVRARREREGSP
jgi:predicted transcriptional regulator